MRDLAIKRAKMRNRVGEGQMVSKLARAKYFSTNNICWGPKNPRQEKLTAGGERVGGIQVITENKAMNTTERLEAQHTSHGLARYHACVTMMLSSCLTGTL